jgi:hypothetical protein
MATVKRKFSDGVWVVDDAMIERLVRGYLRWSLALKYSQQITTIDPNLLLPDVKRVSFETPWSRVTKEVEQLWCNQYRSWVETLKRPQYKGVEVRGRILGIAHNADDLNRQWREHVQACMRTSMKSIEDSVAAGDSRIKWAKRTATGSEYVVLGLSIIATAGVSSTLVAGSLTANSVRLVSVLAPAALTFANERLEPKPVPIVVAGYGLGANLFLDIANWDGRSKLIVKFVVKPLAGGVDKGVKAYYRGEDLPKAAKEFLVAALVSSVSALLSDKLEKWLERKVSAAIDDSLDDLILPLYPYGDYSSPNIMAEFARDIGAPAILGSITEKSFSTAADTVIARLESKESSNAKVQAGAIALCQSKVAVSSAGLYRRMLSSAFYPIQ